MGHPPTVSADESDESAPTDDAAPKRAIRISDDRQLARALVGVALLLTAVLVYWFASARTWDPTVRPTFGASEYFRAQAEAILHGRLHVDPSDLAGECYIVDDRCYGYYGLTPSVLRLPFVPIMRWADSGLTPLFLTAAIMLTVASATRLTVLVSRLLHPAGGWRLPAFTALVFLGPAGAVLVITRPFVYDEAVAWSIAFTLITFLVVVEWTRGRIGLWAAVPAAVAAANARPTAILSTVVLGAGLMALVARHRPVRENVLVVSALIAVLPAMTALGVFMLKFDEPVPDLRLNEQVPEAPAWAAVLEANGNRTIGVRFVPTTLLAYFRPDSLRFVDDFPWIDYAQQRGPTVIAPLPAGGAYTTRLGSATTLMPIPVAASLLTATWVVRRRRTRTASELPPNETASSEPTAGVPGASEPEPTDGVANPAVLIELLTLSATAGVVVTVTNVAITQRNVLDFFPLFVVGLGVGAALVRRMVVPSARLRNAFIAGFVALAAWSAVANFAIAWKFTPGV
jgi:hypothetical protein